MVGESPRTFLDTLAFAERALLLTDADAFIAGRRLRNALLVHEYMHDPRVFLESLMLANRTCDLFFDVIDSVSRALDQMSVPPGSAKQPVTR